MRVVGICHNGKIEKKIIFKNRKIKERYYHKCKDLIICRDPLRKGNPAVSVYPSIKTLIERLKSINKKKQL